MTEAGADRAKTEMPVAQPASDRDVMPAADIIETADAFFVVVDMPGADASTTSVVMGREHLNIEGRWAVASPAGLETRRVEFAPCTYRCAFRVGDKVERERVEANLKNGVLTVKLPKTHGSMPRTVPVTGE